MALWTLANVSSGTLQEWHDTQDAGTITTVSGLVSAWNDKSGNARHYAQGTAANRPPYSATGFPGGSLPAITGDNTNDVLVNSRYSTSLGALLADGGTGGLQAEHSGGQLGTVSSSISSAAVWLYVWNGTAWAFWKNGSSVASGTFGSSTGDSGAELFVIQANSGGGGASGFAFGRVRDGNNLLNRTDLARPWHGVIGERAVISGVVSSGDIDKIFGYANWRWGLEGSLPGGHPYVSAAPTVGPYTLSAEAGAFTLSGQSAGLKAGRRIAAASGAFTLSGQDATLIYGSVDPTLSAEAGAFTFAGQAAALRVARRLVAETGVFSLAGQTAGLRAGRKIAANAGAFSLSGQAAGLRAARRLSSAAGAFALTGQDATLTYVSGPPVLTAAAGAYVITGGDVTFRITGRTWTAVTPASGTWAPTSPASDTWSPVAAAANTWTPAS